MNQWDPSNTQNWSFISTTRDAAGLNTDQTGTYDNGSSWANHWDPGHLNPNWASYADTFNAQGVITGENIVYDDGDTASVNYSGTGVLSAVTYLDGGANDATWSKSVETYNSTGVMTTVDWWNDANVRDERDIDSAGRVDSDQLFDAAGRVDEYATLNDLQQVTDHWYYSDTNALIEHDLFIYDSAGRVDQINAYDSNNHLEAQFYYNDAGAQTADNWYYTNGTLVPEAYEPDSAYDPSPTQYVPNDFDNYIP